MTVRFLVRKFMVEISDEFQIEIFSKCSIQIHT